MSRNRNQGAALKEAMLWRASGEGGVECYLCNHHCRIADSKFGICGMRENRQGKLYTHAYGELIAAHVDPIEKKTPVSLPAGDHLVFCRNDGMQFQVLFLPELADLPDLHA